MAWGWLGLAAAGCGGAPLPASSPRAAAEAVPRHVLLVTIDTLRADRLGAYGYARARTPHLDALAAAGWLATQAYATAPVTLPSHASILTGRYPPAHGARHNGIAMPDGSATLATALKGAGFKTGAFVSAFPLDRRFGRLLAGRLGLLLHGCRFLAGLLDDLERLGANLTEILIGLGRHVGQIVRGGAQRRP